MPRRAVSLAVLFLLLGILLAAPAQAKCCALKSLRVIVPGQGGVSISAQQLDAHLAPRGQGNLYWPVLNGSSKGDHRPAGDLGPRYDITYVLDDLEGQPVHVREVVYLEADPPAAFARKGQTQELYPGDVRAVPWGWRPFPGRAANALLLLIDEAGFRSDQGRARSSEGAMVERSHTVSLEGDLVTTSVRSWWVTSGAAVLAAFVVVVSSVWLNRRRQRSTP